MADHLIAPLDIDMAGDVHRYIRSKGIELILSNGVREIEEVGSKLVITGH